MRKNVREYGLYDKKTGELSDVFIIPIKKKVGGRWMRIFQDAAGKVSQDKLRGESYRVLFHLISASDFNNMVPETGKVGEVIGLKRANVCRAYRELKGAGILIEKETGYYLSPFLAWKGNDQGLETMCKELLKPKVKALPEGVVNG